MMACFTRIVTYLDLMLKNKTPKLQMQMKVVDSILIV